MPEYGERAYEDYIQQYVNGGFAIGKLGIEINHFGDLTKPHFPMTVRAVLDQEGPRLDPSCLQVVKHAIHRSSIAAINAAISANDRYLLDLVLHVTALDSPRSVPPTVAALRNYRANDLADSILWTAAQRSPGETAALINEFGTNDRRTPGLDYDNFLSLVVQRESSRELADVMILADSTNLKLPLRAVWVRRPEKVAELMGELKRASGPDARRCLSDMVRTIERADNSEASTEEINHLAMLLEREGLKKPARKLRDTQKRRAAWRRP